MVVMRRFLVVVSARDADENDCVLMVMMIVMEVFEGVFGVLLVNDGGDDSEGQGLE